MFNHYKKNLRSNKTGFTLVELMLAISIFVIVAMGVAVPIAGSHLSNMENKKITQANAVFNETWEAVRSIRNRDWDNLINKTHGLTDSSGYWEFYGSNDQMDGFTRSVVITDARRDSSGNLVVEGGDIDPDTKHVKVQLSWKPTPYTVRMLEAESLLTNYKNPGEWPPEEEE